ncbi:MAG: succinyl-CoA--3-ketoacid-CoA transferase, partial [Saezia sp.]
KKCTLPLTAQGKVSVIVTELALFRLIDNVLYLEEYAPGVSLETIKAATDADFRVSENLKEMTISQKGL